MGVLLALFIGYTTILVILIGLLESFGGVRHSLTRVRDLFLSAVTVIRRGVRRCPVLISGETERFPETIPAIRAATDAGTVSESRSGAEIGPMKEDRARDEAVAAKDRGISFFGRLAPAFTSVEKRIVAPFRRLGEGIRRAGRMLVRGIGSLAHTDLKKIGFRLAGGIFLVSLVAAAVGEYYLRTQGSSDSDHKYLYRWHPSAGYVLNSHYRYRPDKARQPDQHDFKITTNSHGFRSREVSFKKGGYRVLMLGDSFTFGTGVNDEETFSWLLEDVLRSTPGYEKAEVLNAGTSGSSSVSQVDYFKSEGVQYSPDLVVLNLYTGDDFDQNMRDSRGIARCSRYGMMQAYTKPGDFIARMAWRENPDKAVVRWVCIKPSTFQGIDEYLHESSRIYRKISDRVLGFRPTLSLLYRLGQVQFKTDGQIGGSQRPLARAPEAGRKYTENLLVQFRDYLSQRGMKLLIHVIPYKNEVRVSQVSPFDQESRSTTESLVSFLKTQNIPCVYDASVFEKEEKWINLTYNALQGHYTYSENQVSAAALYRFIAQSHLGISKSDQDRALTKAVPEDIPHLTRSESFFTNNDFSFDANTPGYTRVLRTDISDMKYETPGGCSFGGGSVPFDKDTFESDLLTSQSPRIYYYPAADWAAARLDFEFVLKQRVRLQAVVAEAPAIYPNFSTTKMVVYNAETGEPLGGAVVPKSTSRLYVRSTGEVQRLKISLFRPSGTNTFCIQGLHLVYKKN